MRMLPLRSGLSWSMPMFNKNYSSTIRKISAVQVRNGACGVCGQFTLMIFRDGDGTEVGYCCVAQLIWAEKVIYAMTEKTSSS